MRTQSCKKQSSGWIEKLISATKTQRERREEIVREHMASENRHDFDATIQTFAHPHYELVPTKSVFDGEDAVRKYFLSSRAAFPDQRNELRALYHADNAVIVEMDLLGTHLGDLRGVSPTGKSFRCPMTAFFIFEGDKIICERVYWDQLTILKQLGLV